MEKELTMTRSLAKIFCALLLAAGGLLLAGGHPATGQGNAYGNTSVAADKDMDLLKQRLLASLQPNGADVAQRASQEGQRAAQTLGADGSWPDVDYQDQAQAHWKTFEHLSRVRDMAMAYCCGDASTKGSPALKAKLMSALDYWLKHDFQDSANWWWNMIGTPKTLGETLLMLEKDLTPEQVARGAGILDRSTLRKEAVAGAPYAAGSQTGANLVWVATNQVYRGLLQHSSDVVSDAMAPLFAEIHVAGPNHEGIQADASFHQHHALLYTGGYGASFTEDCTRWIEFTQGTRFAPSPEQIQLLERLVLDGTQWMVRGRIYDYGVIGRSIVGRGRTIGGLARCVERLANLPGPRQKELADFAARLRGEPAAPPLVGNRYFWKSDYMAHERVGYLTSARMYSTRVLNTDGFIDGDNKQTHHIADGAAFIYRTGEEYRDIFPVWDWRRVPGTTCEQRPEPLVPSEVRRNGKTSFVGGVSDGLYGMAAMDLRYDALTAKKAWFYFDNEFVCLGAGIACPTGDPVLTSVNQCLLAGNVAVADKAEPLASGEYDFDGVRWVQHDSVTYAFPLGTPVHVKIGPQTGSWADIGTGSAARVTLNVFSLWIAHGKNPDGSSYEYIVLPDCKGAAAQEEVGQLEVLSNTPAIQAVRHNGLKLLEAAFHRPEKLAGGRGWELSVDQPCLLLCRQTGEGLQISVSNPKNEPLTVTVTIDRALVGEGCSPAGPGVSAVRFVLPEDLQAGSSVTRTLKKAG
jgi:chondroitin AC lyase